MQLRSLAVISLVLHASVALGDGCYFPERAIRKIPEIVAQRAVVSLKNGVETLVVSSALDSESQSLGWIIPLPMAPITISKASPGGLKSLEFSIQPKITHDLSLETQLVIVVMFVVNLVVATWLFRRRRFIELLVCLLLLFILHGLLLPALGPAGSAVSVSEVRIEKTAKVGSYTIDIVRPTQPDGLGNWLGKNGFAPLPDAAGPIVADYFSKGWVLAAIKLNRSESGINAPHPIEFSFAAEIATYPMRLTSVAGGNPRFEIFVIGDDTASCDMLDEEFCDEFSKSDIPAGEDSDKHSMFTGTTTGCRIGHSEIGSLMWDNCIVTKLAGNIAPAAMTNDIRFGWKPYEAHREHFFTRRGALGVAVILFVVVLGATNILLMIVYARGTKPPIGVARYIKWRLLPTIACSAIVAAISFATLPEIGGSDVVVSRFSSLRRPYWSWDQLSAHPEVLKRTAAEIADFLLQECRSEAKLGNVPENEITGAKLEVEDSPGNFTIKKLGDEVVVRWFDRTGAAFVKSFPIPVESAPGTEGGAKP